MAASADAAQNLPPVFDRTDVEFDLEPETEETIDFAKIVVELQTADGVRVLKTLTPGAGLTPDPPTSIHVAYAVDAVDINSVPLFPPDLYQFEARDTTTAAREVVAWGHFRVRTTG